MTADPKKRSRRYRRPVTPISTVIGDALQVGYGVVGISLAIALLTGGGYLLDRAVGVPPLFTVLAAVLGLVSSAFSISRMASRHGSSGQVQRVRGEQPSGIGPSDVRISKTERD